MIFYFFIALSIVILSLAMSSEYSIPKESFNSEICFLKGRWLANVSIFLKNLNLPYLRVISSSQISESECCPDGRS